MTNTRQPRIRFRSRIKTLLLNMTDQLARRGGAHPLPRDRLRQHLQPRPDLRVCGALIARPPLAEHAHPSRSAAPIIVTGRFRAGTTLLWNILRHTPDVTTYYEPFNERRWVDPTRRGSTVDPSHRGVSGYWDEYIGLEDLAPLFRSRWHERNLYMDADARDPAMKRYVEALIARAPGRPVLQFNRIDFRLAWFRATFPEAVFVHVVRNPREQWCSTLVDPARFGRDSASEDFADCDQFYLRLWIAQLHRRFPRLVDCYDAHPYRAYYLLWRLSQLFGLAYAHHSFAYDDLVVDPADTVRALFTATGIASPAVADAIAVIEPPPANRSAEYADESWFTAHEDAAEDCLAELVT